MLLRRGGGQEAPQLTYGSYLRLPQLLDAQHLESDPPAHDELLFITIHQVYELWFQQLLHEAQTARDAMVAPGRERRPRPVVRPAPAQPDARDRAGAGPAGRRAGDDDAAGLPASSGSGSRRRAASSRCSSASWSSSPAPRTRRTSSRFRGLTDDEQAAARADGSTSRRLWDAFVHVLGRGRAGHVGSDEEITASLRAVAHDRSSYADVWGAGRGAAPARRARRRLAGPPRRDGRADDRRARPAPADRPGATYLRSRLDLQLLPAAVGPALGALRTAGRTLRDVSDPRRWSRRGTLPRRQARS